jgi:hypothetical protein
MKERALRRPFFFALQSWKAAKLQSCRAGKLESWKAGKLQSYKAGAEQRLGFAFALVWAGMGGVSGPAASTSM